MDDVVNPGSAYCSKCGHLYEVSAVDNGAIIISDNNIDLLRAFLFHALDELRCRACNSPLGIRPTAILLCSNPNTLQYVLGSRVKENIEEVRANIASLASKMSPDLKPEEVTTLTALRDAFTRRLQNQIRPAMEHLDAHMDGRAAEYLAENWSFLTAKVFTALRVACEVPQVKFQIAHQDGNEFTRDELLELFASHQALSWLALWDVWARDVESDRILEEDLSRYIVKGALLPGAIDKAIQFFNEVETANELPFIAKYCLEAIRSSLYASTDEENPFSGIWATMFFQLEVAYATTDTDSRSNLLPLIISEARARETIPLKFAWDAVVPLLATGKYEVLEEIATKAGHPTLLHDIYSTSKISSTEKLTVEIIINLLHKALGKERSLSVATGLASHWTKHLKEQGKIEDLERVAEAIIKYFDNTNEAIAEVNTWLGSIYKDLRMPQRFLDLVGQTAREWEYSLPPYTKVALWTERSTAFRLLGQSERALDIIEDVIRNFPPNGSEADRRVAERARAIFLRETGQADLALGALNTLLPNTIGEERINTLDSLAITYCNIGEYDDAVKCYEEALILAKGPWRGSFDSRMTASLAVAMILSGRHSDALPLLLQLGEDLEGFALLSAASAWINLLNKNVQLSDEVMERLSPIVQQLWKLREKSEESGDVQFLLASLRLLAGLMGGIEHEDAEKFWQLAYAACKHYKQDPSPIELIHLGHYAYKHGEVESGRDYLLQVPFAIASAAGGTRDMQMASNGLEPLLKRPLKGLATVVLNNAISFEEIRLIAELSRDTVGRAQRLRKRPSEKVIAIIKEGFNDETLSNLAPSEGRLAVIEWLSTDAEIASFITLIDKDGTVSSYLLDSPDIDLIHLVSKIKSRLANWRPRQSGDPFDLPEWHALEDWLVQMLSPHLAADDHLIFIEHELYAGLPWHVAAKRWSSSYATSWTSLLSMESPAVPDDSNAVIGVVFVPKSYESQILLETLRSSAKRTRKFAECLGMAFLQEEDEHKCDRNAFRRIMNNSTVAKLLCHGFVDEKAHEVALMLAHNGALPLALSVASDSSAGRAHRMSWREFRDLTSAPQVVFSAACSSGSSYVVGVGDRFSLFAGLQEAGTRAVIAPRWDLFATEVLPILDETLETYVSGGVTLAKALHAACSKAESIHSKWLAWNLALEGDWK